MGKNKRISFVAVFSLLLFIAVALFIFRPLVKKTAVEKSHPIQGRGYNRIVSMAPSITETLFALGLGDRVIGVTRFCTYPAEAIQKKNIGGFLDPNYEVIAALIPDLVLILPEHDTAEPFLDELDLDYKVVHNRSVTEILGTITDVGKLCDCADIAEKLVRDLHERIDAVKARIAGCERPRVLVSIERTIGAGVIRDVYAAGNGTIYNELILIAGGENACAGVSVPYPTLSAEGIISLNPDIIIDLVPVTGNRPIDKDSVASDWQSLPGLSALKYGRIHVISEDYAFVPGPRFILLLEELSGILYTGESG